MSDSSVRISSFVVHVKCLFWSTRSYIKHGWDQPRNMNKVFSLHFQRWFDSCNNVKLFFSPLIRFEGMEDGLPSRKAEEGGSSKRSQRQQERQGKLPRRRKEVKRSLRRPDCPEHLSGGSVHRLPEQHESEASASAEDTSESCPKKWDRCRYITRHLI